MNWEKTKQNQEKKNEKKEMGIHNESTSTTDNIPKGFRFPFSCDSFIILLIKLYRIHFIMHTYMNKSTSNCKQHTEIHKLIQQT